MNEKEYQQRVVELTEKDTFRQNQMHIFIDVKGRPSYQVVFMKDMSRTSGAKPLQRDDNKSFLLLKDTLYPRLAVDEDALRKEFDLFEKQHVGICRLVSNECTAVRQELKRASEALWKQHDEAQQRTLLAAAQLDRLAEALTKQTSAQQMVDAYRLKNMLDEQIKLLEQIDRQPDAMTKQELEKAEQELRVALELEDASTTAHYRLADVYRAAKDYPRAAEHYRRVLEIDPDYVWAVNGLGMTLAIQGKNEEALAAFRDAVRIAPEMAPGYLNLAVHLERMKRFPESIEAYEQFLDLSSEEEFTRQREIATAAIKRLEARKR